MLSPNRRAQNAVIGYGEQVYTTAGKGFTKGHGNFMRHVNISLYQESVSNNF